MTGISVLKKIQWKCLVPMWRKLIKINLIIVNLFYLYFCFGPQVCIGNSSFRICGVVTWHGCVRNILLNTHTHAHACASSANYTKNFSLHTTRRSHATFRLRHCHALRQTNVGWVLFQSTNMHHRFQYIFYVDEVRISVWYPYSIKARVTETEIFQQAF